MIEHVLGVANVYTALVALGSGDYAIAGLAGVMAIVVAFFARPLI